VKAVEYYLKERMAGIGGLKKYLEFVHFALTSEDVNNLSYGIMIRDALEYVITPALEDVSDELKDMAAEWKTMKMLSLTHGQPATPTTLGKEMRVFQLRLDRQLRQLRAFKMQGKLGGAVGNFSAHRAAYPQVNWEKFRDTFVKKLGLDPEKRCTKRF
jgi:adenylosuccinate lyase